MSLFEDPKFPIGKSKRPHELVGSPKFFGALPLDEDHFKRRIEIKGNHARFFVVAVSSLSKNLKKFSEVVSKQSFDKGSYTGRFHFTFYSDHDNGVKKTIVIDDRLPVSSDGSLIYSQNYREVFWYPLLEKAYAKFRGGYHNIENGLLLEAFFHLTGKKADFFDSEMGTGFPSTSSGMYAKLKKYIDEKHLLVCKMKDPKTNNQLYGSGFTIIDVSEGRRRSNDGINEQRKLVKLRHPSGEIEQELRNVMGISETDSIGEGVMDIEKFLKQMECVYCVNMEEMPVLSRNSGVDAYLPFIPVSVHTPAANKHRCRK